MSVILVPALVIAVALIAIAVRRRRVVVPRPVLVETVRRATGPQSRTTAAPEAAASPRLANGTPPAQVIPLALRDDENLVATPAVVIGLARVQRGNARRAQSSGEIESEAKEEVYDDTLPPTIIVDE
ncbi:MAG TPA: hypothetical protein VKE22_21415 [Haliangiales bacterium]|nr:hypothetical protein [Haliangiales bacterium]